MARAKWGPKWGETIGFWKTVVRALDLLGGKGQGKEKKISKGYVRCVRKGRNLQGEICISASPHI